MGRLRVYDVATGTLDIEVRPPRGCSFAAKFLPDGTALVAFNGGSDQNPFVVYRWPLVGAVPFEVVATHTDEIWRLEVAPDGKRFALGSFDYAVAPHGSNARLWGFDPAGAIGEPLQHAGRVLGLAFSRDGKTLLTGSNDRTTRLWSGVTGEPLGPPVQHPGEIWAVAFSPDGRHYLTAGTDRTVRRWEVGTHRLVPPVVQHNDGVTRMMFTPDGSLLVTASNDRTARFWDLESGQPVGPPLQHPGALLALACSPDGKWVATGDDGRLARIWRTPTHPNPRSADFVREIEGVDRVDARRGVGRPHAHRRRVEPPHKPDPVIG